MKKILIIYGGMSTEHEISKLSFKTIIDNIDYTKYKVDVIYIDKKNNWLNEEGESVSNIVEYLKNFDVVFPIIHGAFGEDGKLQGMLDLFNIKYVGTKTESSSIAFDKDITKIICEKYSIPQIKSMTFSESDKIKIVNMKYPLIVKPARGGSSIGISIINKKSDLKKCIKEAFKYDNKIIIEEFKKVRELECSVIHNKSFKTGLVGEIFSSNSFYDYNAKYEKETKTIIPAKIDKKITNMVKEYAINICKILDIKGYSRVDFLYDLEEKKLYFNEINTVPGFTNISMFLKLLLTNKVKIKDIITTLIENA